MTLLLLLLLLMTVPMMLPGGRRVVWVPWSNRNAISSSGL